MNLIRKSLAVLAMLACAAAMAQEPVNTQVKALPEGAYTAATVTGTTQTNLYWVGGDFIVVVTGYSTGNYTPHIQALDMDGNAYDLLIGAAISANGITVLHVGPGILAIPTVSAAVQLPSKWRVTLAGASTPSMTVVVNANLWK